MMERYEKYKDSGVEWIGEIPEEWDVKRLKYVVSINDESLPETTNDNFEMEYVDISNVKSGVGILGTESHSFIKAPSRARRIVRDGDIIVSTVRTYLKSISKIDNPPDNLIVSTGFAVVRPIQVKSSFVGFLFYSEFLIGEIISRSMGVSYPAINASEIGDIFIPIPRTKEQAIIANYLDCRTAEIDELIAQKECLLELYEEEKTAIINQAVTKGINPDVMLKDSGIDWLGKIPEHWKVKKLKRLSVVKRGASPRPIADPKYFDDGGEWAWVRIADVSASKRYLKSTTQVLSELGASLSVKMLPNSFFLSIAGTVGKPIITKIKCCIHDGFVYFPYLKLNPEFLFYIFSTSQPYKGLGKWGTQLNLNTDTVGEIELPIPCEYEIEKILEHIETETARINAKITKTKKIIALQKEYRTALISEAVTGKIKVTRAVV